MGWRDCEPGAVRPDRDTQLAVVDPHQTSTDPARGGAATCTHPSPRDVVRVVAVVGRGAVGAVRDVQPDRRPAGGGHLDAHPAALTQSVSRCGTGRVRNSPCGV